MNKKIKNQNKTISYINGEDNNNHRQNEEIAEERKEILR